MLLRACSYFVVGGAGFIGSHFVDALLASPQTRHLTIFDNFSSGREWHFEAHLADSRLAVVHADACDVEALAATMEGHDWVIHLASNPDISRALESPEIDFYRGTLLTNNVVEAMRRANVRRLIYASGSGVYGDAGEMRVPEDYAPMVPVSTYGASKLAGEALIASYCSMFGLHACAFRFGNVVGARQTHGVGFDFLRRLSEKPSRLRILGDGQQSKPYSNLQFQHGAVVRYDKEHPLASMHHIDYGLEAMEASVLEHWIRPVFDLGEVWSALADYSLLAGYETRERFYEIGSLFGLREGDLRDAAAAPEGNQANHGTEPGK